MVLTRLPPTMTGSFGRAGCWACALRSRPQPQKAMPVAAAAPVFRKSRRVVMTMCSPSFFAKAFLPRFFVCRRGGSPPRRFGCCENLQLAVLDAGFGIEIVDVLLD